MPHLPEYLCSSAVRVVCGYGGIAPDGFHSWAPALFRRNPEGGLALDGGELRMPAVDGIVLAHSFALESKLKNPDVFAVGLGAILGTLYDTVDPPGTVGIRYELAAVWGPHSSRHILPHVTGRIALCGGPK